MSGIERSSIRKHINATKNLIKELQKMVTGFEMVKIKLDGQSVEGNSK